uniref:Saccharopine dehydrogenase n=1 Tax=Ascaris lumbricoides TaxID=6252 RepID=A0A0M3IGP1_ASCLU
LLDDVLANDPAVASQIQLTGIRSATLLAGLCEQQAIEYAE